MPKLRAQLQKPHLVHHQARALGQVLSPAQLGPVPSLVRLAQVVPQVRPAVRPAALQALYQP